MNDRARTRVQEAPLTYPKAMSSLVLNRSSLTLQYVRSTGWSDASRLGCVECGPQGHGLPGNARPFALFDTNAFMKEGAGP